MYERLLCATPPIALCLSWLASQARLPLLSPLLACSPHPGCLLCPCTQGGGWVFIKCPLYSHYLHYIYLHCLLPSQLPFSLLELRLSSPSPPVFILPGRERTLKSTH